MDFRNGVPVPEIQGASECNKMRFNAQAGTIVKVMLEYRPQNHILGTICCQTSGFAARHSILMSFAPLPCINCFLLGGVLRL